MRPGRVRPGRASADARQSRFNEAGARTPRKTATNPARASEWTNPAEPASFNEAGARTPRKRGLEPHHRLRTYSALTLQ